MTTKLFNAAQEILSGKPLNGRLPFDELKISKLGNEVTILYAHQGKVMFSQTLDANLDAGQTITLPDHFGTVGFRIEA